MILNNIQVVILYIYVVVNFPVLSFIIIINNSALKISSVEINIIIIVALDINCELK